MPIKSHLRPRSLFFVALLAVFCTQTREANAGAVTFYVPIRIEHAPPEMTHGAVSCYFFDPGGRALNGDVGNGSFDIVGGRYYRDLEVIVRRPDNMSPVGVPAERGPAVARGSTYGCRLAVGGDSHVARGTPWAMAPMPWVRGRLSDASIREINELGTCPCGCGGDASNGTAACSSCEAGGIDYSHPSFAGAPPSRPNAHRKGDTLGPPGTGLSRFDTRGRTKTNLEAPGGSPDVHTPAFVFTGTGVIRGCG